MGYATQVCHCLPQAIYFIPGHRYHPLGKFATVIVPESEAFSTCRVYERVGKMYPVFLHNLSTAVTAPSGSQGYMGEKEAYHAWDLTEIL